VRGLRNHLECAGSCPRGSGTLLKTADQNGHEDPSDRHGADGHDPPNHGAVRRQLPQRPRVGDADEREVGDCSATLEREEREQPHPDVPKAVEGPGRAAVVDGARHEQGADGDDHLEHPGPDHGGQGKEAKRADEGEGYVAPQRVVVGTRGMRQEEGQRAGGGSCKEQQPEDASHRRGGVLTFIRKQWLACVFAHRQPIGVLPVLD
jgi:hypothetical protein